MFQPAFLSGVGGIWGGERSRESFFPFDYIHLHWNCFELMLKGIFSHPFLVSPGRTGMACCTPRQTARRSPTSWCLCLSPARSLCPGWARSPIWGQYLVIHLTNQLAPFMSMTLHRQSSKPMHVYNPRTMVVDYLRCSSRGGWEPLWGGRQQESIPSPTLD